MTNLQEAPLEILLRAAFDPVVFQDDQEFESLFGFTRKYLGQLQNPLEQEKLSDKMREFVRNSLATNLAGYPHGKSIYLQCKYALDVS